MKDIQIFNMQEGSRKITEISSKYQPSEEQLEEHRDIFRELSVVHKALVP